MAAFQTNVFRGGEWVTQTIDLQTVLKPKAQAPKRPQPIKAPQCGLLTKTVVESRLFDSILPVRLRGPQYNDVAFIGSHDIQIKELQKDGQLKEVARKRDFGSRIRNAGVVGSFEIRDPNGGMNTMDPPVKSEDGVTDMSFSSGIPPQMLVLALECGYSVFLFLRTGQDGKLEFVTEPAPFPKPREQLVYPGFHLAIDPSSRYMALACAQDLFVVYELESRETLNERYQAGSPLRPVRRIRSRAVQGVIHKVHFLYPRPGDDHHIILLLIIVRNGRSRMVIYEWTLGESLRTVFAEEKTGHRMPVANQMPVLIIPLTVKSAFMAISPDQIAVCTESLHGPPNFETFEMDDTPPTQNHHGLEEPIWTAWARPFRLSPYFKTRDCVYLAREDGVVIFVEADSESAMDRTTFIHRFDSNVSGSFTCMFDAYSDVLLLGSDSGPGAIWKVPARQPPTCIGTLPNWSPCVDFVTTDEFSTCWQEPGSGRTKMEPRCYDRLQTPDRVFGTSGHGTNGSITEYRYGLKASIGFDLEYSMEIKEAWLFPSTYDRGPKGYHLLFSVGGRSGLLYLTENLSAMGEEIAESSTYDISTPTLAVAETNGFLVQVTTAFVVLSSQDDSTWFKHDAILPNVSLTVSDACISDEYLAVSAYADDGVFQIHGCKVDFDTRSLSRIHIFKVDGDVTCLALSPTNIVLAGIWKEGRALLGRGQLHPSMDVETFDLATTDITQAMISKSSYFAGDCAIEAIASIVWAWGTILLGTRSGEVIKLTSTGMEYERFGTTAPRISCGQASGSTEKTVLVACDKKLVQVRNHSPGSELFDSARSKDKLRVWPVEANNLAAVSPSVDYGVVVNLPSGGNDTTMIMMVSGPRLFLAEMEHQPGPVHRHIPIGGTPMKVIYSQQLQCLVAAVAKNDCPTLMFIDPDTGKDLGTSVDNWSKAPIPLIPGLKMPGDRIFDLVEWRYRAADGRVWWYIIVTTREGRILTIGTKKTEAPDGGPPRIMYWLQFQKKRFERPVYAVGTYDSGLIYCVGQTVHCDHLDAEEKKLKTTKSFDLASPATTLRITRGFLMALTTQHSLEIIDYETEHTEATSGQRHVDARWRNAVHMIEVSGEQPEEPLSNMVLVSDRDCGVVGLWVPWQHPGRECEVVLEAELPTSIRRFRRGRTRPVWEQAQHAPRYGRMVSTVDDAEILGISLDGSMYQFTLLGLDAWRLLRFIQNVALTNEEMYPFTAEPVDDYALFDPEPKMGDPNMGKGGLGTQVDGDMLQRCLDKRALERLMAWPSHEARFAELLEQLEGGRYTAGLVGREQYFGLAYDILDYYLRPAL